MGLRCWRVRKQLPMLLGDDLTGSQKKSVDLHVDACPDCREHLAALEHSHNLLLQCREAIGEPQEVTSLWPAIRGQLIRVETISPPAHSWMPVGTLLAASVAIAVVLVHGTIDTSRPPSRHSILETAVLRPADDAGSTLTEFVPSVEVWPDPAALLDELRSWNAYFHLESARPVELTPRDF